MTSLVFLMASNPAALENSKTSPLGTCLFVTASIVSALDVLTMANAVALRKLVGLLVILFMSGVLFPLISFVFKQFLSPHRQFFFDLLHHLFAGVDRHFAMYR